jgi:UDP:flavonoid glycosyltransferase YjiC (YdhE family)
VKIMFTMVPGLGHVLPVVPLAWATRLAGYDVLVATTGPNLPAVTQAGLLAIDVSPHVDVMQVFTRIGSGSQGPQAYRQRSEEERRADGMKLFGEIGDLMADGIVRAARQWKADVLVYTPWNTAGLVAAATVGIPAVVHGLGLNRPSFFTAMTLEHMTDALERHGLTQVPTEAAAIDTCPNSMRLEEVATGWPMRYLPYDGGMTLPDWLIQPPTRPRICLTLGSWLPTLGVVEALVASVEAVRDADVEALVACGGADLPTLKPLPANVRMVRWMPLSALLPTCAAILHHGGSGTTFAALAAGVPQVVLPHGADRPWHAKAVAQRGVGLALELEHADATTIYQSLRRVLDEPAFQKAAIEVRDEIAALPPPPDIVPRLAQLVS